MARGISDYECSLKGNGSCGRIIFYLLNLIQDRNELWTLDLVPLLIVDRY